MQHQLTATFICTIMVLLTIGGGPAYNGPAYGARQTEEVAFVADVSGRVIALSQGKPTLVEALDIISDQTQLDLLANSELRVCHYETKQLLALRGPLRAYISRDKVAVDGKAVVAFTGSCSTPQASKFQGGIVARGIGPLPANDAPDTR
jgi:hypothetical protein